MVPYTIPFLPFFWLRFSQLAGVSCHQLFLLHPVTLATSIACLTFRRCTFHRSISGPEGYGPSNGDGSIRHRRIL